MSQEPASKIALVTGGSRGLGRSIALQLARKGNDVILTYRQKKEEGEAVVAEITTLGRKAVALPLDVSDLSQFAGFHHRLAQALESNWRRKDLDFLINNAGIDRWSPIEQTTVEAFDELLSVHFKGVYFLTQNLLPLIAKHRITSFFAPPTVWIALLRSALFDATDLSSLRKGYYGASIMPVEVLKELARRLPDVGFWNLYGQTEIAPLATLLPPHEQLRKAGSCGRPCINVETRVVDDELRDVKPGEVGEIVHRSPHLMLGYYNDPEKTAAAFAGGWFHSGDLATIDDEGFITVVDRKKDMIKSGGENVASREVEEMIYRLPGVSEVAVIGVPHADFGEGVTAVVAVPKTEVSGIRVRRIAEPSAAGPRRPSGGGTTETGHKLAAGGGAMIGLGSATALAGTVMLGIYISALYISLPLLLPGLAMIGGGASLLSAANKKRTAYDKAWGITSGRRRVLPTASASRQGGHVGLVLRF